MAIKKALQKLFGQRSQPQPKPTAKLELPGIASDVDGLYLTIQPLDAAAKINEYTVTVNSDGTNPAYPEKKALYTINYAKHAWGGNSSYSTNDTQTLKTFYSHYHFKSFKLEKHTPGRLLVTAEYELSSDKYNANVVLPRTLNLAFNEWLAEGKPHGEKSPVEKAARQARRQRQRAKEKAKAAAKAQAKAKAPIKAQASVKQTPVQQPPQPKRKRLVL